jgi:serine protease Do
MKLALPAWRRLGLPVFGAVALTLIAACSGSPSTGLPDFTELSERVSPSVVNISTVSRGGREGREGRALPFGPDEAPFGEWFRDHFGGEGDVPSRSLGSGFVLWKEGYILTNRHVVARADEIIVRFHDRTELPATLVGSDARSDLALLKVEARNLPAVALGDSERLRVGEWVLAIGSPFGFDYSVTAGIVSAKGRSLGSEQYVPYIQTDVAINQGNSGGPLFDLDGRVVGVNSQIYSQTGGFMGISFAIPMDVALKVAEQLRDGGAVSRGWLGVVIQEVTRELAQSFGLSRPEGALVSRVMPDSPGEKAGLRSGDVILKFDGRPLTRSNALPPMVGSTSPGRKVELEVLRDGRNIKIEAEIGELAAAADEQWQAPEAEPEKMLGLKVEPLSASEREREKVISGGVRVLEVEAGAARDAGIRRGDVILSIGGTEIDSPRRLEEVVARLTPGRSVPMLVQRRGSPLFLALTPPGR